MIIIYDLFLELSNMVLESSINSDIFIDMDTKIANLDVHNIGLTLLDKMAQFMDYFYIKLYRMSTSYSWETT